MKHRITLAATFLVALPVVAFAAGTAGAAASPGLLAGPALLALVGAACCVSGRRHAA